VFAAAHREISVWVVVLAALYGAAVLAFADSETIDLDRPQVLVVLLAIGVVGGLVTRKRRLKHLPATGLCLLGVLEGVAVIAVLAGVSLAVQAALSNTP